MRAIYKTLVYILRHIEERTPVEYNTSYGHPASRLIQELDEELREMESK